MTGIEEQTRAILAGIPPHVAVVAAAKTRSPNEIRAVLAGGVHDVAENYVQEAEAAQEAVGRGAVTWHLIGPLQRNKVRRAIALFDLIQTVDSLPLAEKIDEEGRRIGWRVPVLIEVNSGREPQKAGVFPENVEGFVREVSRLSSVSIRGLMTMGPALADPRALRPFFAETKRRFDDIARRALPNVEMAILSMGMSDSYREAIEEGATMIRLGTALFGPRKERG